MTMKDYRNVLLFSFIVIAYAHSQESYHNNDTTGVTAVDDLNLDINERIYIHPNPVTDNEVHITTNGGIQDPIQIKLMDLSGRIVNILNNPMKQSPNKLMLKLSPEIEDGIYIISLQYLQMTISKKLWIKKNIK